MSRESRYFCISVLIAFATIVFFGFASPPIEADALIDIVNVQDHATINKVTRFLAASNLKLAVLLNAPHLILAFFLVSRKPRTLDKETSD